MSVCLTLPDAPRLKSGQRSSWVPFPAALCPGQASLLQIPGVALHSQPSFSTLKVSGYPMSFLGTRTSLSYFLSTMPNMMVGTHLVQKERRQVGKERRDGRFKMRVTWRETKKEPRSGNGETQLGVEGEEDGSWAFLRFPKSSLKVP